MSRRTIAVAALAALALAKGASGQAEVLVQDLGADSWAVREGATRDLVELGLLARPALDRARDSADPEVARRAALVETRIESRLHEAQRRLALVAELALSEREVERLRSRGYRPPALSSLPGGTSDRATIYELRGERVELALAPGSALEAGEAADVHRLGRYVGKIVLLSVSGDVARARIDRAWTIEALAPGDRVACAGAGLEELAEIRDIYQNSINWLRCDARVPAPLDGKIIAVRAGVGLVMLNLGEKHGVEKGMNLTVYRGDEYVGQVFVEEVFPDMASARVDARFRKLEVREGDDATTRIR